MKLKNLLSAVILSLVFVFSASSVFAASAAVKQQSGVVTSYFSTRAAAVRSVNSATRRGFPARMAYNSATRKWAVQINYLKSSTSGSNNNSSGSAVGAGCENALRSAEILYFPSHSMADGIYKAHLRQGDCAKIWNAGSKGWAVAVKAITGRGLRPNRRSRSSVINPFKDSVIKPVQTVITRPGGRKLDQESVIGTGGINSIRTRTDISGGITAIRNRAAIAGGINSIRKHTEKAGGINSIRNREVKLFAGGVIRSSVI